MLTATLAVLANLLVPEFVYVIGVLLGPPVIAGNRYRVLVNGVQICPAMLLAIRNAGQTISFETYLYWSGTIGRDSQP